jgi:crotonobetainyl-CoA:carnitine CoA-transferase CaiB-like acyl-CoA transferase
MALEELSDLKVVEFADLVSGPYCGKIFADLGAEVIKVEAPGLGDLARRMTPFAQDRPGIERSGLFAYLNMNKLSVTLDVKTVRGKSLFHELIKGADILIENHPPQEMTSLGLTYETLEKINPRLIMTSITPFGQTGPHRDYKAYELTTYHGCGYGFISTICITEPVMPPVKAGGRQSEFGAALAASVATMGAVHARDHIGAGQYIDVSIQEVMAGQYESSIQHWTLTQNLLGGLTNPIIQPMIPLECKDGWVFLMCVEDFQYDRLVEIMGNPEWAESELFQDRFIRAEYADALVPLLNDWTMQHTKDEVFKMCQSARIPIGPAYTSKEVVESEHLDVRDYFVEIDHPETGEAKYPGPPYRFHHTASRNDRHAPLLGEHNEEIYGRRLGYTKDDLIRMKQTDII